MQSKLKYMEKLELLNKLSTLTVIQLLELVNNYEMTLDEYQSNFSNLLDDGILNSKLSNVLSFIELCRLADFIGNLKKSEFPITWKFTIEDINKEILTLEELKKIYNIDKNRAKVILNKAIFINNILKLFKEEIKKPSTL